MFKKIWAQHWFVCLLPVAFALAWFAPFLASKGGWLRPEITTKLGVGLIFVLQGLLLPTSAMRAAIGQVRLHAVVQGMTFVGFPLLGLAVAGGIALFHLRLIAEREPAACFRAFLHNVWYGAAIFIGIALDYGLSP
jgi:predicted Na+-dependent transporter